MLRNKKNWEEPIKERGRYLKWNIKSIWPDRHDIMTILGAKRRHVHNAFYTRRFAPNTGHRCHSALLRGASRRAMSYHHIAASRRSMVCTVPVRYRTVPYRYSTVQSRYGTVLVPNGINPPDLFISSVLYLRIGTWTFFTVLNI